VAAELFKYEYRSRKKLILSINFKSNIFADIAPPDFPFTEARGNLMRQVVQPALEPKPPMVGINIRASNKRRRLIFVCGGVDWITA